MASTPEVRTRNAQGDQRLELPRETGSLPRLFTNAELDEEARRWAYGVRFGNKTFPPSKSRKSDGLW